MVTQAGFPILDRDDEPISLRCGNLVHMLTTVRECLCRAKRM
jgi:hypothetical protein